MADKWRFNGFYNKAQLTRWHSAIQLRYACRAMAGAPTIPQWTALSFIAGRCCLPGVRLVLGECDPSFFTASLLPVARITGVRRFCAVIANNAVPMSHLHAGISGEAFVLEATANQVATLWVGGTFRKKECPVSLNPDESLHCIIALGLPNGPLTQPVSRKRKPLDKICSPSPDGWPPWALDAAQAVRAAPSSMNSQPWQLQYGGNSLGLYGPERQLVDLGIALMHMETALTAPHVWLPGQDKKEAVARVRLLSQP